MTTAKKYVAFKLELLPVILVALIITVTTLTTDEAVASTDEPQTSSNNVSGFHSALDTYVASEPDGYGMYETRQSNVFRPGETLLLYVEPEGMTYSPITVGKERLYNSKLSADITISDNAGNVLSQVPGVPLGDITSHHQNQELFLVISVDQHSPFPAGEYIINYAVKDDISGDSFEIIKNIAISG